MACVQCLHGVALLIGLCSVFAWCSTIDWLAFNTCLLFWGLFKSLTEHNQTHFLVGMVGCGDGGMWGWQGVRMVECGDGSVWGWWDAGMVGCGDGRV